MHPDIIVEETGASTENEGRTTAVFMDPTTTNQDSEQTWSGSGGGESNTNQNN